MAATIDGTTGLTAPSGAIFNGIASGTAVASTSGTSIDFTSIPSWVKRITVMFSGVSTNGASLVQIQLGSLSGGVEVTGYLSGAGNLVSGSTGAANSTTGLLTEAQTQAATSIRHGSITITNVNSNIWTSISVLGLSNAAQAMYAGGSKTLSYTLDRVRITTVNGTDTFDAGSINILYE